MLTHSDEHRIGARRDLYTSYVGRRRSKRPLIVQ